MTRHDGRRSALSVVMQGCLAVVSVVVSNVVRTFSVAQTATARLGHSARQARAENAPLTVLFG